ncbi:unnamed protein product [Didymodactylos carnosus]|uniref:Uncharacterized protein n=1 Tax=Didymodactylos carnosus TaxID=1234261 RepID=A0A815E3T6_9BILA|nr:unnamed protein product [Didymodactylos carnosus]CAF1304900.1 unnamed protein product [Didymodactylos carnosus]CAF3846950.1 unnamed protein product [Didymodactylos carnosus]CAF4136133.1 unnamed protein product [Didymodactylos carnosus]
MILFPRVKLPYRNLPANITVTSDEQQSSVRFHCSSSVSLGRVIQIACQLWKLNKRFYRLTLADDSNVDDDYALDDIDESIDDLQLKLISMANVKCTISNRIELSRFRQRIQH